MGKLKDFVNQTYANDPLMAVRFVNRTNRLVRIGKHYWRGRRQVADGTVNVSGRAVGEGAVTKPSWKLLPRAVGDEFANFEKAVDELVKSMCVSSTNVAGENQPLVFGGGVYAVDVGRWPELNSKLKVLQAKWDEAANSWCTDDGYRRFHEELKEQVGETEYANVEKLVPPASKLRASFWLEVTPLTFQLTEQVGDPDEDRGRLTAVSELVEAAVKGPREEAAAAWNSLAAQMVQVENGKMSAYRPTRDNRDGTKTSTSRRIVSASVVNARKALDGLARCARFHDPDLISATAAVARETSADPAVATRLVQTLNSDDAEAVRVAQILIAAAEVAADEARMCVGVGKAMANSGG